jgi:hypothetical protein
MEWLSLDQIPHENAILNTLFESTRSRLLDDVTIVAAQASVAVATRNVKSAAAKG